MYLTSHITLFLSENNMKLPEMLGENDMTQQEKLIVAMSLPEDKQEDSPPIMSVPVPEIEPGPVFRLTNMPSSNTIEVSLRTFQHPTSMYCIHKYKKVLGMEPRSSIKLLDGTTHIRSNYWRHHMFLHQSVESVEMRCHVG